MWKIFLKKFSDNFYLYSKSSRNQSIFSIIPKFYFEYIIILIFVLLVIFLQSQNLTNDQIFTSLTLFSAASVRVMPCFTRIAAQIQSIIFYKPTVETLFKEIKDNSFELSLDKVLKSDKDINVLNFKSSINIQNLYFNFPGKQIFENANVIFPKKQNIGLIRQKR